MITGIRISEVHAARPVDEAIANMKFNINFDNVKVSENGNVEVIYTFTTSYEGGEKGSKSVGELKINGSVFAKEDKEHGHADKRDMEAARRRCP